MEIMKFLRSTVVISYNMKPYVEREVSKVQFWDTFCVAGKAWYRVQNTHFNRVTLKFQFSCGNTLIQEDHAEVRQWKSS